MSRKADKIKFVYVSNYFSNFLECGLQMDSQNFQGRSSDVLTRSLKLHVIHFVPLVCELVLLVPVAFQHCAEYWRETSTVS